MEDLLKRLKVSKEQIEGQNYARLNLTIKELCEGLGVAGFKIFEKLEEKGVVLKCPILVSAQDVKDYHDYESRHRFYEPFCELTEKEKFEQDINHLIANSAYFDIPFKGEEGKVGLKDTLGNITVPPIFDWAEGTDYLFYDRTMARVKKDGKIWLTPRDGGGEIKGAGYEKIEPYFSNAYVQRNGRQGFLDLESGKEVIPAEMEWLKQTISDYVFIRNGKIGYYFYYGEEPRYVYPQFEAINLSTHQFFKEGEWGYLLEDTSFTTEIPRSRRYVRDVIWDSEHYFEKNPNVPEQYYTLEEMEQNIFSNWDQKIKERTRSPRTFLKLTKLQLPESVKIIKEVKVALEEAVSSVKGKTKANVKLAFGLKHYKQSTLDVYVTRNENNITIELTIDAKTKEEQWELLALPKGLCKSFNQILYVNGKALALKMNKTFTTKDCEKVIAFISYFFEKEIESGHKIEIKIY